MSSTLASLSQLATQQPILSSLIIASSVAAIAAAAALASQRRRRSNWRFGSSSTAAEVSAGHSLSGRIAIVTGSTNGIGKETARVLALRGAEVIVCGRTLAKAQAAINEMRQEGNLPESAKLVPMAIELSDLRSVQSFVAEFKKRYNELHLLVLNAGVMAIPTRELTAQGFEMQMGTNHLGHFLLAIELIEQLKAGARRLRSSEPSAAGADEPRTSRVVVLSSIAHRICDPDFLQSPKLESASYEPLIAYGNSKMANVLFAAELHRRFHSEGIEAASVHPGGIWTGLQTHTRWGRRLLWTILTPLFFKSIQQGASTSVLCCVLPDGTLGGRYFQDCHASRLWKPELVSLQGNSAQLQKFWDASEVLVKPYQA